MTLVRTAVDVAAPPAAVWDRLTDWPAHGRWVPFTRVRVTGDRARGVGAAFVGRTGVGPLGFDDPMEVVEWRPPAPGVPGHCAVVKLGRVIRGSAEFEVVERPGGSTAVWTEDVVIGPPGPARLLGPLVAVGGRVLFGRMLRRMAREVERRG